MFTLFVLCVEHRCHILKGVNGEERDKRGNNVVAAKKLHNIKGKGNKFTKSGRPQ